MPTDIESTRNIIESNGTDTCNENTVECAFKLLEYVAIETFGMCYGPIHILALLIEHSVGEVVVFVNDKVKIMPKLFGLVIYQIEFFGCLFRFLNPINKLFRISILVNVNKTIKFNSTITVETLLQPLYCSTHLREIQMKNLKFSLQRCRMRAYPQISKPFLKLILCTTVIVSMEHTKEYALAKTSWANEEQVVRFILQHGQIHCLVDIIVVLLNDFHKV